MSYVSSFCSAIIEFGICFWSPGIERDFGLLCVRQGHQEYLDETQQEQKVPWRTLKSPIRAVEFCRITQLDYSIVQETGRTCCDLTLKFTDANSRVVGKSFKLTLPELTNFPDFIVERSRYDGAMQKGWGPRDKCQVWWGSDESGSVGGWWDGRVVKTQVKSAEFPDSPWERLTVIYKLDSNDPARHSPWELFEPGNHWHDPPHIDDESKAQLLSAIHDVEKSCYVGHEVITIEPSSTLLIDQHTYFLHP